MQWLAASALLMVTSVTDTTQAVHLSGLSLQLPQAWTVKTDGQYVVMGSLSTRFNPHAMPWVAATLCDDASGNHRCPASTLDVSRDKQCTGIQSSMKDWPHGIKETRWVCPLQLDQPGVPPGVGVSTSVSLFEFGKKKLFLTYLATDHDTPPTQFLDAFASGLRPE